MLWRLAAALVLVSCGASHDDRAALSPITIAVDPVSALDGGPRDAAAVVPVDAAIDEYTPVADGWRGPRDATGLIGAGGAAVTGTPETIVLVHSAAIRVDARREPLRQILLGALPGWNTFMPYDVVDPIVDVDWVLMAGSLVLGTTASNVFIAHYNLSEARADSAMATLLKTLPRALVANSFGRGAFTAFIDGADRVYMRPRPGVLAIVPLADGKRIAELLAGVDVPADVRPGEILRVVDNGASRIASLGAPQIQSARYWMTATRGEITMVRAEAECPTESDALAAAASLTLRLRAVGSSMMTRLLAPWLARITPRATGTDVRASVGLREDEVSAAAAAIGCRGAACP